MFEDYKEIDLGFHGVVLPKITLTDDEKVKYNVTEHSTADEILTAICRENYKELLVQKPEIVKNKDIYIKQIKHELQTLKETKFSEYIILVWDVINFCRKNKIPVGVGRGSASSSLVNYILKITEADPIEWKLYFERFISKSRAKSTEIDGVIYYDGSLLPDIDLDISDIDRYKVVEYLKNKMPNKVSKVCTINTLQTKSLIKELGKIVRGYSEEYMNTITDAIPSVFGKVRDIDTAIEESPKFKLFTENNQDIIEIAKKLYESPKSKGVHASAYILTNNDIEDFIPTEYDSKSELCASFDMHSVSELALKLDLLGLSCVATIEKTCELAGISRNDIDIYSYEDIYAYLQHLETPYGLFQISGDAVVKALNKMKPKTLPELSNVIAIARPGAMHFIDDYVQGVYPVEDEKILDILKDTNGICIFQEQLIAMGRQVFGLTADEAELVRRACAKKKPEEMKKWLTIIEEKARQYKVKPETKDYYLRILEDSANYSFAAAHSAAYATLAAMTVYLKFKYPKEFYLASILCNGKDEIPPIERELPLFNIKLLRPDIIKSDNDFKIEGDNIRYGLSGIKGLSDASMNGVTDFRKIKDFLDPNNANKFNVFEAAKSSKINIKGLASIINAGALNSLGDNRPKLVLEAKIWNKLSDREKLYCFKNGENYNYDLIEMLKSYTQWTSQDNRKFTESRLETIRKECAGYLQEYAIDAKYRKLAAYLYEKKLLGYSYSYNIREVFTDQHSNLMSVQDVKNSYPKTKVELAVEVISSRIYETKKGVKAMKLLCSDETGTLDIQLYGPNYIKYHDKFPDPEEGDIIYIIGETGEDIVWARTLEIQKLNNIKEE